MKLIRRKKQPTTFERVTGYVGLGAKGLAVQRVARRVFKSYKFTRRAVPLLALAVIGAVVAKKVGGAGDSGAATPSYSPPATTTPPSAAPASEPPSAASGASDTPPPGDASRTEDSLDIDGPNQSTPPPPESTPAS